MDLIMMYKILNGVDKEYFFYKEYSYSTRFKIYK